MTLNILMCTGENFRGQGQVILDRFIGFRFMNQASNVG